MRYWWVLLVLLVAGLLFVPPASREAFPPDLVTGADHSKFIRIDVFPGSASPSQIVCIDFDESVYSLCGSPECSDLVVVDSSGTVVPFGVVPFGGAGFRYVVPVTISNPNSYDLVDYQVRLVVDTESLIEAGKMRTDCADIRFFDASGSKLSYWVESGCGTSSTVVWVKVPYVPAGGSTTIYMFYGNLSAPSESDGGSVFIFFDDFDVDKGYESIGPGSGTYSVSASVLYMEKHGSGAGFDYTLKIGDFDLSSYPQGSLVVELLFKTDVMAEFHVVVFRSAVDCYFNAYKFYGRQPLFCDIYSADWQYSGSGDWEVVGAVIDDFTEGSFVAIGLDDDSAGVVSHYVDWIRIRKYAPEEPSVVFGSERLASLCFDPSYDGSWESKSFYVLLGSANDYSSLRTYFDESQVGDFTFRINAVTDVSLYKGHAVSSVSPDTDEPGDKTVMLSIYSDAPTGVSRAYCSVLVRDPILAPKSYEFDVNGSVVSFTHSFVSEGVYVIEYNCDVFFTERISGAFTHTVVVPDPAVPDLSLSVSGVPSALSEPADVNIFVLVTSEGSPVGGVACYLDYNGQVYSSDTNAEGYAEFSVTLYPDTSGVISCYKSGYHAVSYVFEVSSSVSPPPGGAPGGGVPVGGVPGGASGGVSPREDETHRSVYREAEVSVQQASPLAGGGGIQRSLLVGAVLLLFVLWLVFGRRR